MGAAAPILAPLFGVAGAAASLIGTPKPKVAPTPTVDAVETQAGELRRLRLRRGAGANQLLGEGGAEAATAAPKQLTGA